MTVDKPARDASAVPANLTVTSASSGMRRSARLDDQAGNRFRLQLEGRVRDVELLAYDGDRMRLLVDGEPRDALVAEGSNGIAVFCSGYYEELQIRPCGGAKAAPAPEFEDGGCVLSHMPAIVSDVCVRVGQRVGPGDALLQLESMKMVDAVTAPRGGVVTKVHVQPGQAVRANQPLVSLSVCG